MRALLTLFTCYLVVTTTALAQGARFEAIAYHDVRDGVADDYDPDQYAISTANLIDHFTWLKLNGFTPVSVDQLLAAQRGESDLPEKPVLLTFDDGLRAKRLHTCVPAVEAVRLPCRRQHRHQLDRERRRRHARRKTADERRLSNLESGARARRIRVDRDRVAHARFARRNYQ